MPYFEGGCLFLSCRGQVFPDNSIAMAPQEMDGVGRGKRKDGEAEERWPHIRGKERQEETGTRDLSRAQERDSVADASCLTEALQFTLQ